MKPKETFDFQIRKSWIGLSKMYNELVAPYGITVSVGFALLNIDVQKGTPSTALGPKMGMESTSLSRVLKSMEKQGLIVREPNSNDRRSVMIKLTESGKEKRNHSRKAVLGFNEKVRESIGRDRAKEFFSTLEEITAVMQEFRSDEAR
jgi:DNA-binding MarR family transcriptional regulator